ncbi:MAG: 4Fe-4S binding protein [Chloroflexi bacterium]|nr:4Fe-4S binding protein [Chloroflexota bacterium]
MTTTGRTRRSRKRSWTQILRRATQAAFALYILAASVRHGLLEGTTTTASIDALCPFGGLETLWRFLTEGAYVPKTHTSNLVLGLGLLLGTLIGGAAFCGWVCPFGALQDALTWLRTKLRLPQVRVPSRLDRWLRYGRFVTLALILYMTASTVKLWFASYDPYRTIFGLGWLFEFNMAEHWPAYLVAITVLALSFLIPRFWCKYLCPLGGVLSLLGHFSLLRIRRDAPSCKSCALCETPCPVGLPVASANPRVSTDCIGCLACVDACPRHGALEVQLAPAWLDGFRSLAHRLRRPSTTKEVTP